MKRVLVGLILLAVVLGTGGYAVAQSRESELNYRTATATTASVQRTMDLSGTVSASGRRDLTFGTSGTVSSVAVTTGKRVSQGQVLARLDGTSLRAVVTSAVATLARGEAQLVSDKDAQADAVTATAAAKQAAKRAKAEAKAEAKKQAAQEKVQAAQAATAAADQQQQLATLKKQQSAVTSAQSDASAAIATSKAALTTQQQACADSATTGPTQECTAALAAVQSDQDAVAAKQDVLQAAIATLADTLTVTTSASSGSSAGGTSGSSGSGSSGGQSKGGSDSSAASSSSSTSGSMGGTVTAATLAKDQAEIDTATADLGVARASLSLATLRAPYDGRIVQVGVSRGGDISSSDTAFILVGSGVTTVTASLTTDQVASIKAGQQVTVTPAGSTAMTGEVTQVSLLPDSDSNYIATVTVQSDRTVAEGTTAALAIVVGSAADAVTVPTSAVTRAGSTALVSVLKGSTVTRTRVTLGVIGTARTSITDGLAAGAKVVLADLASALPSTDSSSNTRRGFGGSGNGPGGPPGVDGGPPSGGTGGAAQR